MSSRRPLVMGKDGSIMELPISDRLEVGNGILTMNGKPIGWIEQDGSAPPSRIRLLVARIMRASNGDAARFLAVRLAYATIGALALADWLVRS